ncbi:MAG: SH3 domain-containing protein [Cyanobacteriota bacterium]|nr:SH3 domain-containing protein [Cyanobacteriota bacterium]
MIFKNRSLFQFCASLAVVGFGVAIAPSTAFAKSEPRCQHNFRVVQTQDEGGYVNMRESTTTDSAIIGTLDNGTEVIVSTADARGRWASIHAPGDVMGWVSMEFLVESPAVSSSYNGSMEIRTLDGDALNIRSNAQPGTEIVGTVNHGEIVEVLDSVGYWREISTASGVRGYVVGLYVVCSD